MPADDSGWLTANLIKWIWHSDPGDRRSRRRAQRALTKAVWGPERLLEVCTCMISLIGVFFPPFGHVSIHSDCGHKSPADCFHSSVLHRGFTWELIVHLEESGCHSKKKLIYLHDESCVLHDDIRFSQKLDVEMVQTSMIFIQCKISPISADPSRFHQTVGTKWWPLTLNSQTICCPPFLYSFFNPFFLRSQWLNPFQTWKWCFCETICV